MLALTSELLPVQPLELGFLPSGLAILRPCLTLKVPSPHVCSQILPSSIVLHPHCHKRLQCLWQRHCWIRTPVTSYRQSCKSYALVALVWQCLEFVFAAFKGDGRQMWSVPAGAHTCKAKDYWKMKCAKLLCLWRFRGPLLVRQQSCILQTLMLPWIGLALQNLDEILEIEDSPVAAAPLLASNGPASMASSGVPPVPASWTSRALDSHSVDVPNLLADSQLQRVCATQQSLVPTPSLLHEGTTASLDIHGFGAGLRQMPSACYLDNPQGEVDYYFAMLASTRGDCALHQDFWESIPEYSQYISGHTFAAAFLGQFGKNPVTKNSCWTSGPTASCPPTDHKLALGSCMWVFALWLRVSADFCLWLVSSLLGFVPKQRPICGVVCAWKWKLHKQSSMVGLPSRRPQCRQISHLLVPLQCFSKARAWAQGIVLGHWSFLRGRKQWQDPGKTSFFGRGSSPLGARSETNSWSCVSCEEICWCRQVSRLHSLAGVRQRGEVRVGHWQRGEAIQILKTTSAFAGI